MIKSNLEPIEEKDLDLEGKIKRGFSGTYQEKESRIYVPEKEVVMEVSSAERDAAYGKILSKVQSQNDDVDQTDVAQDAQVIAKKDDAQSQVSHLVDIAGQKGVFHAVKVARHMEDNYILDTFHDKLLASELHDALVAKGMINEI